MLIRWPSVVVLPSAPSKLLPPTLILPFRIIIGEGDDFASWVNKGERIISAISVEIDSLRINKALNCESHWISRTETPLRACIVPCLKEVESRFNIPLALSELLSHTVAGRVAERGGATACGGK